MTPIDPAVRRQVADRMAEAALLWLDQLDRTQRRIAVGAVPADDGTDAERRRWFYTPVDHGGLTLRQQQPAQHQAAMRLVSTGLSQPAYVTVALTMGLEDVLDLVEGFTVGFDRERGRDPGLYYLRVFGDPGGPGPWGWRFGGHHVSLNNLVVDGELVSSTPLFLGANPAVSPLLGGGTHRPLGRVEDLGRELFRSLSGSAAEQALLLPTAPPDFVGDPATDQVGFADPPSGWTADDHARVMYTPTPKGIAAADLDAEQRGLLRALLGGYLGRAPEGLSPASAYADDPTLDGVHFAWAGSTALGEPHYYRLQGPRLLVEWDNTQNDANHAHSVWRDPTTDFGLDVLARHRAAHHHH